MTEATTLSREPVQSRLGSDNTPWFEQYLPHDEAVKRIKTLARNGHKKNRSVFLTINQEARTDENHYFPVMGSVRVTADIAVRFVEDAYKNFTERGALVHLSWCDTCVFIG